MEPEAPLESPTFGTDDNMDVNAAADSLAESLRLNDTPVETKPVESAPLSEPPETTAPAAATEPVKPPPESDWTPGTWRAEAKSKWATLDPLIREEVKKREQDISRYVGEAQPQLAKAKQIDEIIQPYQGMFKQYDVEPLAHIKGLLEGHTALLFGSPEVKTNLFRQLAKDAGINLATLVDPNATSPAVSADREYIGRLEAQVMALKEQVTNVAGSFQEVRKAELSAAIAQFAEDTENHPYFWELAPAITQLIETKAAGSLEEAYDIAKFRDPTYRTKVLEAESTKQATLNAAAESARAAAARKASSVNVKSRSSGRTDPAQESIEDTLRETMANIKARSH